MYTLRFTQANAHLFSEIYTLYTQSTLPITSKEHAFFAADIWRKLAAHMIKNSENLPVLANTETKIVLSEDHFHYLQKVIFPPYTQWTQKMLSSLIVLYTFFEDMSKECNSEVQ